MGGLELEQTAPLAFGEAPQRETGDLVGTSQTTLEPCSARALRTTFRQNFPPKSPKRTLSTCPQNWATPTTRVETVAS